MNARSQRTAYWEFELVGGLRYGWSYWFSMNATWPLATICASPKQIVFHVRGSWGPDPVLNPARVKRISPFRGFLSRGVRFEHDQRNTPSYLVFWTRQGTRLLAELRAMGYPVA